ncbi:MAG TPA: hypothetical protein VIY48_21865 [Candidatus Paceibacterota bacterium]
MADQEQGTTTREMSFDDMGAQLEELEKANRTKLEDVKVDGDDVPENLRGKTARDLLNYAKSVEQALKTSESARQEALILAQTASAAAGKPPVVAPPEPKPEPELTREQLRELYETDPLAAIEAMQRQALVKAESHLQARLEPLISGAGQSAEQIARTKFPEEFEVLSDEIKQMVESLPDKRMLSQPGNWEQLVTYVRGQHMDKMFNHRMAKATTTAAEDARREQIASAGFHGQPDQRAGSTVATSPTGKKVVWDDYTAEIARTLGMSKEDYIAWSA